MIDNIGKAHFRLVPYRILPRVDWFLIVITLALAACGVITLWGATSHGSGPGPLGGFALKQIGYFGIGLGLMIALIVFNYQSLKPVSWILYGLVMLMLLGLCFKGQTVNGARSWYNLGVFKYQPSETAKLITIIVLAQYLAGRTRKFRGLLHIIKPMMIVGVPMGLIMLQPDFGSTVVFMPVTAAMFWVAGLRKYVFLLGFVVGLGVAMAGYPHLKQYQKERIKTFLDPSADPRGKGWNIMQSMTALGSGQLTGKGWGKGTQTNFKFLPEYHTDFIFPTVGEQFGMIGCSVSLLLMFLMVVRMVHLATQTQDMFGVLIITGLSALFCTHIILNVGMTVGLLPVTGLPLPFFSYGGSFVITCMASMGLVLGIGARRGL